MSKQEAMQGRGKGEKGLEGKLWKCNFWFGKLVFFFVFFYFEVFLSASCCCCCLRIWLMLIGLEFAHRINIYKCKQFQAVVTPLSLSLFSPLPLPLSAPWGLLIVVQTNKVFPFLLCLPLPILICLLLLPLQWHAVCVCVCVFSIVVRYSTPHALPYATWVCWARFGWVACLAHVLRAVSCWMALAVAFGVRFLGLLR